MWVFDRVLGGINPLFKLPKGKTVFVPPSLWGFDRVLGGLNPLFKLPKGKTVFVPSPFYYSRSVFGLNY